MIKTVFSFNDLYFCLGEESDSSSSSSGSESDIEKEEKISSVLFMQVAYILLP